MKYEVIKNNIFKSEVIKVGKWKISTFSDFPHCDVLSADTETKLYYKDKLLTDDDAYNLYKINGQSWCKENIEVVPYAFMLADFENFLIFNNAEDFLTACAMFNVSTVIWYNAKFDFAIFDYYFLTNGWVDKTQQIQGRKYGKLPDKTYISLNSDFGQRYQMQIWKKYKNRSCQEKVRKFTFVDLCNIYGGGLAKNLIDWEVKDRNGNDIRKLDMNYTTANFENDIQYMYNDTVGLYLLAEKINNTIYDLCKLSFFKRNYITAGGLAKKVMLEYMFGLGSQVKNINIFHKIFPISLNEDLEFREKGLYMGGKTLVNPYKINKIQSNVYKYDVNSMYPYQMLTMLYPIGKGIKVNKIGDTEKNLYIIKIKNFYGYVKKGMIPILQDKITGNYENCIIDTDEKYYWLEELNELKKWYNLTYEICEILEFKGKKLKGIKNFIETFYNIKCNSKGSVKQGAKLFLNSAYGKIAQKIVRKLCVYEIADGGYVHLVQKGEEVDIKNIMSVVVGSRVTALSRVMLLTYIRNISNGNVAKNFIYCDTDSVHSLSEFNDTNDKEIGKMKFEGVYEKAIYLAPKSYLMYNDLRFNNKKYEVHCKGVNVKVVAEEIKVCETFDNACNIFKPNKTFKCLAGLNVKGGKALIYVDKMIVNDENIEKITKQYGDLEDITDMYGEI